jgi:AcrR family transcriptional regulator
MDPRVARTHDAVMHAAFDLLLEGGPAALTVDGVVARSGVAKSTVYRHWATRDDLVAAVLTACAPTLDPIADDVSFGDALRQLVEAFMTILRDEHWNRIMPAILLLKSEAGALAELDEEMREQQHGVVEDVLRRGVAEGALPATVLDEVDVAMTLLSGPLLMAGLTGLAELDDALAERVIEQFLAGQQAVAPTA